MIYFWEALARIWHSCSMLGGIFSFFSLLVVLSAQTPPPPPQPPRLPVYFNISYFAQGSGEREVNPSTLFYDSKLQSQVTVAKGSGHRTLITNDTIFEIDGSGETCCIFATNLSIPPPDNLQTFPFIGHMIIDVNGNWTRVAYYFKLGFSLFIDIESGNLLRFGFPHGATMILDLVNNPPIVGPQDPTLFIIPKACINAGMCAARF